MVRPSVEAFADEFRKIAAQAEEGERDVGKLVGGGAVGLGGAAMLASPTTRGRLLGYKRVYHGTAAPTADKIRQEGLKTSFGGTGVAANDIAMGRDSANVSKGHVYVTGKKGSGQEYAAKGDMIKFLKDRGHSTDDIMAGKVPQGDTLQGMNKYIKGQVPGFRSKGRIDIDLPFEKFRQAKADPLVKELLHAQIGDFATDKFSKERAAILAEDINPKYMKGGVGRGAEMVRRLGDVPGYIAKNPGRFGKGLIGAGLGAGAMLGGAHLIRGGMKRES